MALSAKERQQKYREKQKQKMSQRLDMMIDNITSVQLENLALHGNKSKKEFLVELINKEFERKVTNNEDNFYDFIYGVKPNDDNNNDNLDLFEDTLPCNELESEPPLHGNNNADDEKPW